MQNLDTDVRVWRFKIDLVVCGEEMSVDCNAPNLTAIFDKNESYLLIDAQESLKQGKFTIYVTLCDA